MAKELRLTWQKATDGYRIEPLEDQSDHGYVGLICYGGSLIEVADNDRGEKFVVPRNRRSTSITLLAGQSRVLFDLANTPSAPQGVQLFANKWGALDNSPKIQASDFYRRSVEVWRFLHLMSSCRWDELSELTKHRSINAGRDCFASDGISTFREPRDLREFCFLDLMELIEKKAPVLTCPKCKAFFTRQRRTRRACCDGCRKAISKRRRRKGRSGHEGQLDVAEAAEIEALWRTSSDILIVPDRKRAYVGASEACQPPDEEFLRAIASWML